MNESMHKYMKVGLIHFMAFPSTMKGEGPIVETIKRIACDDYFSAIELTWIKDPQVRKEVKKILTSSHMAVGYGAQPRLLTTGMNINDLNEEGRAKAVASLKEGIDEAYEIGAKGLAFLSGKYQEETKEQSYQALLASTKELCAYAKSKGNLRIVLEVFDYDIDKKSLIGPAPLAKRFAEDMMKEYDNFGLMVDLSHIPMIYETCEESILPIKDYLVHAHMGNTVIKDPSFEAYGDTHPRFGFPNGENDVEELVEFLKVLMNIGFLNTKNPPIVSFEVKPWGDEDPELVIANAKRTLNEAWARL
ncbi:sugar phosphate isomerase/epimerase [Anaerosolibacter carboniphilus]|uniref:Sugar phosphate isomerase/epimerase n=1 Tax=Anaerosolibacter carboniphilus TaxID=1417629 RepID=A0A841KYA5_9FIRM|nr:TIM barrel protein [Anaerosolibacter carboniphilus]MBB6217288.1 sugar phosphate isomerase/epimerase [Anaerosolibacter carboniphilus]